MWAHAGIKLRTRMYVWLASSVIRPFNTVAYLGMDTRRSHSYAPYLYDEPYNDDDDNNDDEGTTIVRKVHNIYFKTYVHLYA